MVGSTAIRKGMLRSIINIAVQAVFKLMFSVASLKVVAFYVGPSGMAVVGQVQSFLQVLSAGVSSVTTTGVVKLIAEDKHPKENVVRTSAFLLISLSFICFFILLLSGRQLANYFLQGDWFVVLILLPLGGFFIGLNNLFVSYFNGMQKYTEYFWYSMITAFVTALSTCAISFYLGKVGAIYSIVVAPAIAGVCILFLPERFRLPRVGSVLKKIDGEILKVLVSYSFMALGSAVVVYGGQIFLRNYIATNSTMAESGLWYAATRLSDIYMGICSVLFSTLLLPKYSSMEGRVLDSFVWRTAVVAIVFGLLLVLVIGQLAGFIVWLIYGEAFAVSADVLKIYVMGDGLKCLGWIFLYVMLAKQRVRAYLVYEVITASLYLASCIFFYRLYGLERMAYGYVLQGLVSLLLALLWFFISRNKTASVVAVA
ncbi:oligosaccharide flippase family protein [Pseudomonas corrugata]|uniref:oligosaccharide flippase family protein n=1 Tax=Pseudomonas corrugata TaxID=47879 RepID=UPI0015866E6C|nr:oligosaccharide flippase family protein [Pseudomonas corrugata]MCI0994212.1 oligosaccharide flippase family protein [Pseudomonas corrugata]NUT67396.1 oligosaccharide flippase family protein [Pseudomonas corrugata]